MFGQAIKAFVETSRELGSTKEETIGRIIEKYRYQIACANTNHVDI